MGGGRDWHRQRVRRREIADGWLSNEVPNGCMDRGDDLHFPYKQSDHFSPIKYGPPRDRTSKKAGGTTRAWSQRKTIITTTAAQTTE